MSLSSRRCLSPLPLPSLLLPILTWCGKTTSEPTAPQSSTPAVWAVPTWPALCLTVPLELWKEEGEFFSALVTESPFCPAGPVVDSSQGLTWWRSGRSRLALIRRRSPMQGGPQLLRQEPFALAAHVSPPPR